MPYEIIVDTELPAEMREMIGAECDVQIWPSDTADRLFHTAAGMLTYGHPRVDGGVMDRMPNLKVISNFGVGVDHIDLAAARVRGIPVGNTPHILDGATADMTFALLLTAARNVVIGERYAHSAEFTHYDPNILIGSDSNRSLRSIDNPAPVDAIARLDRNCVAPRRNVHLITPLAIGFLDIPGDVGDRSYFRLRTDPEFCTGGPAVSVAHLPGEMPDYWRRINPEGNGKIYLGKSGACSHSENFAGVVSKH